MPAAKNVNINVQGDFSGNIIIGDNNIVYGNQSGAIVNKVKQKFTFESRARPVNLRPRAFPNLLSRTTEIQNIKNAITNSMPVTLFGENGIGKTSVLRQVAHLDETTKLPDGVVYIIAKGEERGDLLQLIFDTFYTSNQNQKPTDAQLREDLKKIQALIILDDLTLKREDTAFLLDAIPNSTFIFSSDERSLWGEGQAIGLDGLPEHDALQLFERELGRAIKDDEKESAVQICKILLHHPLRILQTASMIREDSLSIPQAFTMLTKTRTQSPVLEATLQKSNETQKKILSLLAVAGGFALTREHLQKLAGSLNFDSDMKPLLAQGFVEAQGASFSLNGEAVASLVRMWDLSNWEDALMNHFSNWLQTAPQDMLVDQVASTLFYLIQRAGEKRQWKHVLAIGRRLEQIYALKKKWEGWLKILNLLRMAASALKDKFLEGWVLHQLGSRAMSLGMKTEASELLNQALNIRKAISDKGGISATQHNLDVLMNVTAPKKIDRTTPKPKPQTNPITKLLLFGGTGTVAVILLIIFCIMVLPPISSPPQIPPPTKIPTDIIIIPTTAKPAENIIPTTRVPTFTRTPTRTPTKTPTRTITPTPTPQCYLARYVKDITYPDGSVVNANAYFIKTWRLKNEGSCVWDSKFQIVLVSGTNMPYGSTSWSKDIVKPGETVDVSFELYAPNSSGTYRSEFKILASDGTYFGLGAENKVFWVKIKVNTPPLPPIILSPLEGGTMYCNYSSLVQWSPSSDDSGVALYEVDLQGKPFYCFTWCSLINPMPTTTSLSFDVSPYLECSASYYIRIRAKDNNDAWSEWSGWRFFNSLFYIP